MDDDTIYDRRHIVAATVGDTPNERFGAMPNSSWQPQPKNAATFTRMLKQAIIGDYPDFRRITITPEFAEILLKHTTVNRPLSDATARNYARMMTNNGWPYTRAPIIFSVSGAMLDGQHRATGVVISGVPIEIDVAFCAPDDSFEFLDVGKSRSDADIFSLHGVKHATIMSSAIKMVFGYANNKIGATSSLYKYSGAEWHGLYEHHTGMQSSANFGRNVNRAGLASPSLMCAIHYLCAAQDSDLADEFFTQLADGTGMAKGDAVLTLREKLLANDRSPEKMTTRKIFAITIKAWNYARKGRKLSRLNFADDETFPKIA